MKNLKKNDTHAGKFENEASGVDGDSVMITFGPSVLEAMQELHRMVCGNHEKFDDDAAHILQSLAYGKPVSVRDALVWLTTVSQEAGRCEEKTGDLKVGSALIGIRDAMLGNMLTPDEQPVTVTVRTKPKSR